MERVIMGRRSGPAEDAATVLDAEMWAARISDLVLKSAAVAERARTEAASTSREARLSRLDAMIVLGQTGLLRLSGDAPRHERRSPVAAGRSNLSSNERMAWLRLVVAEQALSTEEARQRHNKMRADARRALDALRARVEVHDRPDRG
ncbi:MAG: hypothetical protein LC789_10420 [Actinobacteria bacterium]|nr:hypothetical protein [Actinomycetota bacterium]MCA1721239.1 hypothetical protein [Actinomycetota bacterium]